MTTQELVDLRKRTIRNALKGYDNTLKLKGKNSLSAILDYVENTPSANGIESNTEALNKINNRLMAIIYLKLTEAQRTRNKRLEGWLRSKDQEIQASILEYDRLCWKLFSIDSNTINKYNEEYKKDGIYSNIIVNNGTSNVYTLTIRIDDKLYSCALPTYNSKEPIAISTAYTEDKNELAVYNYFCRLNQLDNKMNPISETEHIEVACSNTKCPLYKASANKVGEQRVYCSVQDCEKCDAFNGKGQFKSPYKVLEAVDAIMYAMNHRYTPTTVINEGVKPDYQPLPIPESDKEVVVYIDDSAKESVVRIVNHDENYIPGTHASPREHERRGHFRRNPKTGLKTVWVRGCTVNKGHTKTSYKIKYADNKECVNE